MKPQVMSRVRKACERREGLAELADSDAVRLVHSEGDDLPGITVDKLANLVLVERHRRDVDGESVITALTEIFGADTPIFLKERWSKDPALLGGAQISGMPSDGAVRVRENGLVFGLDVCRGEHVGLFLDSRVVRKNTREVAKNKRVLNLFSYTGGFGVAAAAGGARSTTNVDNKKSALKMAEENYRLNDLPTDTRTFMRDDSLRFLKRGGKGKGRYDLVVLDPPPRFHVAGGRVLDAVADYPRLLIGCLSLLDRDGELLLGLNHRPFDPPDMKSLVQDTLRSEGYGIARLEEWGPGADFPEAKDRPVARFLWLRVSKLSRGSGVRRFNSGAPGRGPGRSGR